VTQARTLVEAEEVTTSGVTIRRKGRSERCQDAWEMLAKNASRPGSATYAVTPCSWRTRARESWWARNSVVVMGGTEAQWEASPSRHNAPP